MMIPGNKRIAGLGSALVDILIHESDEFLAELDAPKGGMVLVDKERIDEILSKTQATSAIVPGGSACNTVVGVSRLGGKSRFIGKCSQDEFGHLFETGLVHQHVEPRLFRSTSPTGRVLSVITPDAQRTMLTYLGASAEMNAEEMKPECFEHADIVHIEGYLLFNPDLMMAALKNAKNTGARISLDLASYTVVEASRDLLKTIVAEYVDIVIANEDESLAYTGVSNEMEAISLLAEQADIAVLKLGKRGSLIADNGRVVSIAPHGAGPVVDTTGAGDLWASGFLYGLVSGLPIETCGSLASMCGYEVCQVIGASIPEKGWERISSYLLTI
ncbi:MAG: adenosine kinase [Thermodesulfobacteriota bacterium]